MCPVQKIILADRDDCFVVHGSECFRNEYCITFCICSVFIKSLITKFPFGEYKCISSDPHIPILGWPKYVKADFYCHSLASMQLFQCWCSAKGQNFPKSTSEIPGMMEELPLLWAIGTQETPNLVRWKAEAVKLTNSYEQGVFSAEVLS